MLFRNRQAEPLQEGAPAADDGAGNLLQMRQDGLRHLSEGSDAIDRALSRDSQSFLRSTRQQGGQ